MSHGIQIAAQADRFATTAPPRVLRELFANSASASASSSHEAVAHSNPAVAACSRAHRQARDQAKAAGKTFYEVNTAGREAFRRAMPPLDSPANITNFIACVAHGLLLEIINDSDSARLLYAAQVASSAARLHTKSSGRPPKTAPEPPVAESSDTTEAAPLPENQ